jgi:hypothetical protein
VSLGAATQGVTADAPDMPCTNRRPGRTPGPTRPLPTVSATAIRPESSHRRPLSDPVAKAARVRDFCAAFGALEESASGTTAAALAVCLAAHGALEAPELAIGQGVEMERPSRIEVTVAAPDTATVRGRTPKLLSRPLELPRGDAW